MATNDTTNGHRGYTARGIYANSGGDIIALVGELATSFTRFSDAEDKLREWLETDPDLGLAVDHPSYILGPIDTDDLLRALFHLGIVAGGVADDGAEGDTKALEATRDAHAFSIMISDELAARALHTPDGPF